MIAYIIRRVVTLLFILVLVSVIVFILIQLPPGDFVTMQAMNLRAAGQSVREEDLRALTVLYGLDKPLYVQYLTWMRNMIFEGNFGLSFTYFNTTAKVSTLLAQRVPLTVAISLASMIFVWLVAVPIGIYSATHQYSIFDYFWTVVGFAGMAIPGFLLALVILWIAFSRFGISAIGLFSPQYEAAPWSVPKALDLLKHIWVPVAIIGTEGTAGLIRVIRANLMDELHKQYVITARSKGLPERRILFKYPVRMAINPIVSTIGWMLPSIVSGEVLVSSVLNIPTTGPLLLHALIQQDMYLAGSILLILSTLTVTGTLVSDILLTWLDPRIRFD